MREGDTKCSGARENSSPVKNALKLQLPEARSQPKNRQKSADMFQRLVNFDTIEEFDEE